MKSDDDLRRIRIEQIARRRARAHRRALRWPWLFHADDLPDDDLRRMRIEQIARRRARAHRRALRWPWLFHADDLPEPLRLVATERAARRARRRATAWRVARWGIVVTADAAGVVLIIYAAWSWIPAVGFLIAGLAALGVAVVATPVMRNSDAQGGSGEGLGPDGQSGA